MTALFLFGTIRQLDVKVHITTIYRCRCVHRLCKWVTGADIRSYQGFARGHERPTLTTNIHKQATLHVDPLLKAGFAKEGRHSDVMYLPQSTWAFMEIWQIHIFPQTCSHRGDVCMAACTAPCSLALPRVVIARCRTINLGRAKRIFENDGAPGSSSLFPVVDSQKKAMGAASLFFCVVIVKPHLGRQHVLDATKPDFPPHHADMK